MVALNDALRMSPEEFLAWEETQPLRHEYLNGYAYAMSGGTSDHSGIAINLAALLRSPVRDRGCRLRGSDFNVFVSSKGPYFYPNLSVSCHLEDITAEKGFSYPSLLIEVLSPSTAVFDMGEKFGHYQQIKALQEYILVQTKKPIVLHYQKNSQNQWWLEQYVPINLNQESTQVAIQEALQSVTLQFRTLNFTTTLADIYEDVIFQISPPFPTTN